MIADERREGYDTARGLNEHVASRRDTDVSQSSGASPVFPSSGSTTGCTRVTRQLVTSSSQRTSTPSVAHTLLNIVSWQTAIGQASTVGNIL